MAIILILGAAGYGFVHELHPFLAPMNPLPDGALVIEGWVDDSALEDAVRWTNERHYHPLFITGGPIPKGAPFSEFRNVAEWTAATMRQLSEGRIEPQTVPYPDTVKDRTYTSAVTLKTWMQQHGGVLPRITLFSAGPHSRRSRLLFQKAFGSSAEIGVISSPPQNYDRTRWWVSSEGFRSVTSEAIAYAYARLIFWPSPSAD